MNFTSLLDILFPKSCLSCSKEDFYICPACFAKIPIKNEVNCRFCGKRRPDGRTCAPCKAKNQSSLTGLLIASEWNNLLVRQMIYECKYRSVKELAKSMAEIMVKFLKANQLINAQTDKLILMPVPLHKRRLQWRGFNQSLVIAQGISSLTKIPVENNLIIRNRYTRPQMEIKDRIERIKNIAGAFALNQKEISAEKRINNKIIILIDDVCTTASTFEECADILRILEPKEIWGLALARG